ncbi:hypothetical protein DMH17_10205 [Raoultella planticola]|nr:hypothetical protein [Raoultella planticola]
MRFSRPSRARSDPGGLDILVNNAEDCPRRPLESLSLEDIDALINVNIRGVVIAIRAALPHLPQEGALLISAVASPTASPSHASAYCRRTLRSAG